MKSFLAYTLVPLSLFQSAIALTIRLPPQETLHSTSHLQTMTQRQRLRGDNDAYYCGPPPREQLFEIEEFDVAPSPPTAYAPIHGSAVQQTIDKRHRDHRFFAFLQGWAPDVPNLNDSVMRLTAKKGDDEPFVLEEKLVNYPQIVLRQKGEYTRELKPGRNELVADYVILGMFLETGDYSFTAEARLPDGRVLFCFESSLFLEGKTSS